MPELEAKCDESIIKDCKLDACIDRFLMQLGRMMGEGRLRCWYPHFNYRGEFEDQEKFNEIKNQLIADIRRLVPDYFDSFTDGSLDLENMRDRIYSRLQHWRRRTGEPQPDTFHRTLLRTLVEQQHRKLQELTASGDEQAVPSLQQNAFTEACRQLKESIEGEHASASFACGGTILIGNDDTVEDESSTRRISPPVHIFWATEKNSNNARRLVLPLGDTEDSNANMLRQLVMDCSPATFGKGDKDVLDSSYRKAGKLDRDQFASSFHPADFGILENIEQILLPSVSTELENCLQFRKVTADLYKLNAYSGPSGHFCKHVDTPRSANQIGSLVVCLPSPFKGGNLIVRHHGQEVNFDWSPASASTIQWAAFYSDCEHEIKTITEGDRITLTYNLYVTEPVGSALSRNPIVEPKTLPLYGYIRALTEQPGFMKEGGVLGMFCSHAYAHTSDLVTESLPRALKGSDLVLYSVFKSLGYEVDILPVMESNGKYDSINSQLGIDGSLQGKAKGHHIHTYGYYDDDEELSNYLKYGSTLELDYETIIEQDFGNWDNIDIRWKVLLYGRRMRGIKDMAKIAREKGQSKTLDSYQMARVGKNLDPYFTTDRGQEEDIDEVARDVWPFYYLPGITWLTGPKHEEMAFSQVVYGNETGIGTRYSCAAIFVIIPPWQERAKLSSSA
ncbi:hypothetical protein VTN77DRAFT_3629 [Rasamsonia byssochlamydoides]|uniref:uncharacterized protein n=1 Tax=Rasamsonia byssochlamydoides TaxID=89139 RepID=UPI0037431C75